MPVAVLGDVMSISGPSCRSEREGRRRSPVCFELEGAVRLPLADEAAGFAVFTGQGLSTVGSGSP